MARKKFWLGTMGPYYYDDAGQPKAIIDENGNYLVGATLSKSTGTTDIVTGINVTTETITIVTGVDFVAETITTETITYVTGVTADVAELTYVTDVTLETT